MKNLKEAKERAENYLYRIIEQKWDRFVKNDKRKPPKHYYEEMDWSLKFEAYSYLGNKYKNKVNSFAIELRELWNEWVELNKKGLLGREKIFWPTQYYLDASDFEPHEFNGIYPGSETEIYISMFRVKEILGIGGFNIYFNEAKKRIENILFSEDNIISLWIPYTKIGRRPDIRIISQIVRSPFLKFELSDLLKVIALKIIEDEDFKSFNLPLSCQATFVFFLCFGNFGSDLFDKAKKVISELIDKQAKNGSFGDDVKITCLCASAIHSTKLDRSNSVCSKALDYILRKQNKEGYWDFLFGGLSSPGYSTDWNVLSTVVVLETLDLITNDKPLPIWALEAEPEDISRLHKHPRIQIDKPLSVPGGINWSDISIWFISPEEVEVRAGIPLGVKNFIRMGFRDGRIKKPDLYKPDLSWDVLRNFAKLNGEISWKDKGVEEKVRNSLKSCVKVIRKRLQFLFGIQSDPFHPYDRGERSYRTRFKISSREDNQD